MSQVVTLLFYRWSLKRLRNRMRQQFDLLLSQPVKALPPSKKQIRQRAPAEKIPTELTQLQNKIYKSKVKTKKKNNRTKL